MRTTAPAIRPAIYCGATLSLFGMGCSLLQCYHDLLQVLRLSTWSSELTCNDPRIPAKAASPRFDPSRIRARKPALAACMCASTFCRIAGSQCRWDSTLSRGSSQPAIHPLPQRLLHLAHLANEVPLGLLPISVMRAWPFLRLAAGTCPDDFGSHSVTGPKTSQPPFRRCPAGQFSEQTWAVSGHPTRPTSQ